MHGCRDLCVLCQRYKLTFFFAFFFLMALRDASAAALPTDRSVESFEFFGAAIALFFPGLTTLGDP